MEFLCLPNNPDRFATNLRQEDNQRKNLTWDNAKGQGVLMVQTSYGKNASECLENICKALSELDCLPVEFTEILPEISVKYISAAEKAKKFGCPLNGEASRYTVFSCSIEDDSCKIYESKDQAMISSFLDIPLEIEVGLHKETIITGVLKWKKEVDTGFYSIHFPGKLVNSYLKGSLLYRVNDFEIPVTKEMIEKGTIYIQSDSAPVLVPKTNGLKINIV